MYFTEKFVAPIIKRFGGDPERGEFGLFGGVQGKGELDVFKAQMIVSEMNSGGWKGAPSLYYERGGEIKIVQGNYRLLAAMVCDAPVDYKDGWVEIDDKALIKSLEKVTGKKDQRAVLFGSKYCDVFDQHEAERKVFYRPYKKGWVDYDWRESLAQATRKEDDVRAWNVMTGGTGVFIHAGLDVGLSEMRGAVEILGEPNAKGDVPCSLIDRTTRFKGGVRGGSYYGREVGVLKRLESQAPVVGVGEARDPAFEIVFPAGGRAGPYFIPSSVVDRGLKQVSPHQDMIDTGAYNVGVKDRVFDARAVASKGGFSL